MAFVFVRSVGTAVTSTGSTCVFTVGASGAAIKDVVFVGFAQTSATVSAKSVGDSKGNVYTLLNRIKFTGITAEIWVCRLTAALASGDTITATYPSSVTTSFGALEFTGTGTKVDVVTTGTNTADVPPPAALTTVSGGDLVLGFRAMAASSTLDTSPPTNYTLGVNKVSSVPTLYWAYSIVTGPTARTLGTAQYSATGNNVSINTSVRDNPTVTFNNFLFSNGDNTNAGILSFGEKIR